MWTVLMGEGSFAWQLVPDPMVTAAQPPRIPAPPCDSMPSLAAFGPVTPFEWLLLAVIAALLLGLALVYRRMVQTAAGLRRQYQTAADAAGAGVWTYDPATGAFRAEQPLPGLLGYEPDDMPRTFEEIESWIPESDRTRLEEQLAELLAGCRSVLELQHRIRHRTGTPRWFLTRGTLVEHRGAKRVMGASVHISNEVHAAEALDPARHPAEAIIRGAEDMIYFLALPNLHMTLLNDAAARITGYSMDELKRDQRIWRDIVHPTDMETTRVFHSEHREGVEQRDEEYRLKTKDGSWKWMQSHMFASRDAEGTIAGYFCVDRDITRQKRAEEAQRGQEIQIRAVYDNAVLGLMLATPEGIVLTANEAVARLVGVESAAQLERRSFCENVKPAHRDALHRAMRAVSVEGQDCSDVQVEVNGKAGRRRWLSLTFSPVPNEDGCVTSLAVLALDVTAQRRSDAVLVMLRDLGLSIGACETAEAALHAALDAACSQEPLDCGSVYTVEPDGSGLRLAVSRGLGEAFLDASSFIPADSPALKRLAANDTIELSSEEITFPSPEAVREEGVQAALIVPIQYEGALLAAFALGSHREAVLPETSVHAVASIAQHVGAVIQRMKAQAAYQETLARVEALVRSVGDMVYFQARDGSFQMLNEAHLRITGYTKKDFQEREFIWREIVHPDDLRNADRIVARYPNGAGNLEIPYRLRTKMGEWRWMQSRMVGAYAADGQFMGYYCVDRDITRMKRIEQALRDAEQRHSDIIDFLPEPTLVIDGEHRVMAWNKAMERMTGVSAETVVWHGDYEHALPFYGERRPMLLDLVLEPAAAVQRAFPEARRTGDSWECEEQPAALENGQRFLIMCARGLTDTSGNPVGAIGSIQDITEIRMAEQSLRRSEDTMRLLFNSVRDAIFVVDAEGRVTDVNTSTLAMFGLRRTELDLHNAIGHYIVPDGEDEDSLMAQLTSEKEDAGPLELMGRRIDTQAPFPVEVVAGRITLDQDARFLLTVRDISERKRAEAERNQLERQLLQAQKLESLGVLAGGIAHDFNNLLMGILGNASMAALDVEEGHPAAPNLRHIEAAAQRAADLTQQLLAYSGQGRFVVEPLSLTDLTSDMLDLLRLSISKRSELRIELAGGLPAVEADATQVRQILMNLVTNASDAMGDEGGVLSVCTGRVELAQEDLGGLYAPPQGGPGPYVYFEVADTGCGIEPAALPRIFDPFFTTKFAGRGLGLAAVLGIVQGHSGGLQVRSVPGQGSCFRVLLPESAEKAAPSRTPSPEDHREWQGSGTVLLADDEEAVRNAGMRMLERAGYNVIAVEDGAKAVQAFEAQTDAIFMAVLDVTMPHMDGKEALAAIRRIRSDIPILLTSGYNQAEILDSAEQGGPTEFLQKPFRWTELIDKIRRIEEAAR